jgi:branched-chain amino acid transport system substrate-binding protein
VSKNTLFNRRDLLLGGAGVPLGAAALRPGLTCPSTQGVTDNEIFIGALGQLNGPFAFIGVPARDNMQMAIDKLNEAGGVNGRRLKLVFEHASTAAESLAAAKKLVEDDKVFMLVIATGSTGAAAADFVRAAKIPTYNTVGATAAIRKPFARNIFHGAVPSASITGESLVGIGLRAFDLGFKTSPRATRIGVLAGTYAFPQSHLAEMKPLLETSGFEVVVEQFEGGSPDYTEQLVTIASHQVEILFILGSFREAGLAIKQARKKGLMDTVYVVDGTAVNDAIVSIAGVDNTSNLWGYYNAPYYPTQREEPIASYCEMLTERYGGVMPDGRPNVYDLIGYGSTYILAQVLRKAGKDLSWDSMIRAWEMLNDAKPSGMGGFDVIFPETIVPTDHQGNKKVALAHVINGSWHVSL